LADDQLEVATPGGEHDAALDRRRPNDLSVEETLDVLQDGISVIRRAADRGVGLAAQQERVGTVDARQPQLAHRLRDRSGIAVHVGWKRQHRVAAAQAHTLDPGGRVPLENRTIFREGDLARCLLEWVPVRIIGATLDVVDRLAREFERNAQLDERPDVALRSLDAIAGSLDPPLMTRAHRGEIRALRAIHVHDLSRREVALESAGCFLFDLGPCRARDWGELPMKVIHVQPLLSVSRYPVSHPTAAALVRTCHRPDRDRATPRWVPERGLRSQRPRGMLPRARRTATRS